MQDIPFSYTVIRRSRKRNITITVSLDGQVTVSGPKWSKDSDFERAIASKQQWILQKLQAFADRRSHIPQYTFAEGDTLPYLGEPFTIVRQNTENQRIRIERHQSTLLLKIPSSDTRNDAIIDALESYYIQTGKTVFAERTAYYARQMRVHPTRITVKRQKRRWGSCNATTGSLNFNWKLMMAPLWVLDYVVVHELAHLREANHSPAFWAIVDSAYPAWPKAQTWLKDNGLTLTLRSEAD